MIFNQGYSDFPSLQCDKCINKDISEDYENNINKEMKGE